MINFESFGYRGHFVFSPPITVKGKDEKLILLATPYGNPDHITEGLNKFILEFENLMLDPDTTSPFAKLTCYDSISNNIHVCTQYLNDYLYSSYNKDKINVGCDFICIYKTKHSIYVVQIGWPLLLLYNNKKLLPISSEYSFTPLEPEHAPFLPTNLLGLESSVSFKVQQMNTSKDSELLILKSNEAPDSLISLYPNSIEDIAKVFAKESPEQGFWLGKVS